MWYLLETHPKGGLMRELTVRTVRDTMLWCRAISWKWRTPACEINMIN